MAKIQITVAQAIDHLEIGKTVRVANGGVKPSAGDEAAMVAWQAKNFTATVVDVRADGIDLEVTRPNAVVINHFGLDAAELFEIDEADAKDKAELSRRRQISAASHEELITRLFTEIDELRARIDVLEIYG